MNFFPAQYSTLSSKALNIKIQDNYQLSETTCKLLIHNVSDSYIIETPATKYIFKIYRDAHRKLEEIKGEIELLTILNEKGAKVSYPIPDKNGDLLQTFPAIEGIRYGVLFSWAKGEVINLMTKAQLDLVGKEMATIHNLTSAIELKHYRKDYSIASTITNPLKIIEPAFIDLPEEYEYLKKTSIDVIARITEFPADFSYGYCHFDFFPKNFHYTADGEITFFDFDFAGKGFLAYDITSFYIHYFLDVTNGRISADQGRSSFKTFVDSYRKVRPLSNQEIEAIPDLGFAFWVFYLGFQYENFDDWSNSFFGPNFLKARVSLIRTWMNTSNSLLCK